MLTACAVVIGEEIVVVDFVPFFAVVPKPPRVRNQQTVAIDQGVGEEDAVLLRCFLQATLLAINWTKQNGQAGTVDSRIGQGVLDAPSDCAPARRNHRQEPCPSLGSLP